MSGGNNGTLLKSYRNQSECWKEAGISSEHNLLLPITAKSVCRFYKLQLWRLCKVMKSGKPLRAMLLLIRALLFHRRTLHFEPVAQQPT
jgi:hypothetical protein